MKLETHHYPPGPESLKPCAVDGELCQPFPERESVTCSWHWFLARVAQSVAREVEVQAR